MPGAHQHAAFARHQREDMAGGDDFAAALGRVDRHRDGVGAVMRGNAGGDALARLDRDGEGGFVPGAVGLAHQRQAELLDALAGHGEADEPARVAGHEVDPFRRSELRRDHQVAFVFPVFIVDQDEHAALAGFLDQLLGRGEVVGQAAGEDLVHRNSVSRAT